MDADNSRHNITSYVYFIFGYLTSNRVIKRDVFFAHLQQISCDF